MSFDALLKLIPPPAAPQHASGDFAAVETRLGISLPADYKQIVSRYGAGAFADFLIVLNPFEPHAMLNLDRGAARILDSARSLRNSDPDRHTVKLHPEPGGLFPWAVTEGGDTLFWQTDGPPDQWKIVLRRSSEPDLTALPLSACQFLSHWISGKMRHDALTGLEGATDFPFPQFIPFRRTFLLTAHFSAVTAEFDARVTGLMRHFQAKRVKTCYAGWQGFRQCTFRGGKDEVLIAYLDVAEFGSRMELHVPKAGVDWAVAKLDEVPNMLGMPFRRTPGAQTDFSWAEDPLKAD